MKLLIPVNKDNMNSGICQSFGRAPVFLIWNSEQETVEFAKNPGAESASGAGIHAAQKVIDLNPDAVVTHRMGKNTADVITSKAIKLYKSPSDSIIDAIEMLNEGKIQELTDIHPGFHGHG